MCLIRITDDIREDEGYGWKIYSRGPFGKLRSLHQRDRVPCDRWVKADPVKSALGYCGAHDGVRSPDYRHGFHLFADPSDAVYLAESYSRHFPLSGILVKRVRYRGRICSGEGNGGRREIVALEIFVPSETEWTVMREREEPVDTIARRLLRDIRSAEIPRTASSPPRVPGLGAPGLLN